VLLALLAALGPTLNDVSRTLGYVVRYQLQRDQYQVTMGRGLWCALLGVLAVLVALYLAGRHTPPVAAGPVRDEAPPVPDEAWFWRRPRTAGVVDEEDDRPPAAPIDLTVGPTRPFTTFGEDRDKPSDREKPGGRDWPTGRDGISG
jgi:hypothetical protein